MTDRNNVLLIQIVNALTRGCGGAELEDDAADWFHTRYYEWITKTKTSAEAGGKSPQDVWDSRGKDFLLRFYEIGEKAVNGSRLITMTALSDAAFAIEKANECPWCPDKA